MVLGGLLRHLSVDFAGFDDAGIAPDGHAGHHPPGWEASASSSAPVRISRPASSFFNRNPELPHIEPETPQDAWQMMNMGTNFPGGDVMNQSLWRKHGPDVNFWPPEERWYRGARLGEYARPIITNRNALGPLPTAPVPLSASEDDLAIISQASAAAKRAKRYAIASKEYADLAKQFLAAAQHKAQMLFQDPPISVLPTADVFPMYSASMGGCTAGFPEALLPQLFLAQPPLPLPSLPPSLLQARSDGEDSETGTGKAKQASPWGGSAAAEGVSDRGVSEAFCQPPGSRKRMVPQCVAAGVAASPFL